MPEEDIKENKAKIEELSKRIAALTEILVKEGITSKEEVDELTDEMIRGKDE